MQTQEFDKKAYQRDYMRGRNHGKKGLPREDTNSPAYLKGYETAIGTVKPIQEKLVFLYQIFEKRARIWIRSAKNEGVPLSDNEKRFLNVLDEELSGGNK